ncbi:glycoside hydrolase family 43 protein [Deminuibacter soli]|uniref:Glycosyl hydrolase family 43 n=1 Tax=Deminuibacter soli TaxID=2291815 RepID=A0A3E1NP37_9BACT|nr:glycoside hydrolase family 43 protein [Deminuibacter soli]RFM29696.1 glycosyl hydrolase family 43 [Deminuibacter soli]
MKLIQLLAFAACLSTASVQAQQTFTNPILPSGPDPYSFYKNGYYYYTSTTGHSVELWKTKSLGNLKDAEHAVLYRPPQGMPYSKELWAPEVMELNGKWYAYFAADDGSNDHHRMYVLENNGNDPMKGEWTFRGKVSDPSDKWAIDGDVFLFKGKLYMVWSGWEGDTNGRQDIYIAAMSNPWTIEGNRVKLSSPEYSWEKNGDLGASSNPPHVDVNEGPQALQHKGNLFVVYSASGCWTDFYALGLLRYNGKGNILDPTSWSKHSEPVFKQSPENEVYAPGHNSFFKSPDGKQDWILYHANSHPGDGCGGLRSPRMQPFTWKADGMPDFGTPVKAGAELNLPSSSK